jgi:hypothetical protein
MVPVLGNLEPSLDCLKREPGLEVEYPPRLSSGRNRRHPGVWQSRAGWRTRIRSGYRAIPNVSLDQTKTYARAPLLQRCDLCCPISILSARNGSRNIHVRPNQFKQLRLPLGETIWELRMENTGCRRPHRCLAKSVHMRYSCDFHRRSA